MLERRRLERNLHDGAQQRLVALAVQLRVLEKRLGDRDAALALLRGAAHELEQALAELRELARGLHPAVLADRGLAPALETLASRAPLPVIVDGVPEERLAEPLEAAVYFVVAESLTNAVKHAEASELRVSMVAARRRAAGGDRRRRPRRRRPERGRGHRPARARRPRRGARRAARAGVAGGAGTIVRAVLPLAQATPCASRELVAARRLEGLTIAEVAAALGCTADRHRARPCADNQGCVNRRMYAIFDRE